MGRNAKFKSASAKLSPIITMRPVLNQGLAKATESCGVMNTPGKMRQRVEVGAPAQKEGQNAGKPA